MRARNRGGGLRLLYWAYGAITRTFAVRGACQEFSDKVISDQEVTDIYA